MKKLLLVICCMLAAVNFAHSAIRVVTTSSDLKYIAEQIGGDRVSVESLSTGDQDLHMVEPRPSMVMKLKKADMIIKIGLDLDMWADSLIAASRNKNIVYGAQGYVDASAGVPLLEVPKSKIDGSMGDIHIFGNPHYSLDPGNARFIARNIEKSLAALSPGDAAYFEERANKFVNELNEKIVLWKSKLDGRKGLKVVTYHNSWIYFAKAFGLEIIGNIEPKPGIPPSPAHLNALIETMKSSGTSIIIVEPYFPLKGPQMVAEKVHARVIVVPSSVGGMPGVDGYFGIFDYIINELCK
jgi:ABC-type Zn uptake system ZnuABC Zn-binding protein ZnuA